MQQPQVLTPWEGRPRPLFQEIFTHKMCDETVDINSNSAQHFSGWANVHRSNPRFFLKGVDAIQDMAGTFIAKRYAAFGDAAIEELKADSDWKKYTVGINGSRIAEHQFGHAIRKRPATFERLGVVIVACELLYKDEGGRDIEEFYRSVSILPACYNIDGYSANVCDSIKKENPNIIDEVSEDIRCEDAEKSIINNIARGNCCTRHRALSIKQSLQERTGRTLGLVRPRPGSRVQTQS